MNKKIIFGPVKIKIIILEVTKTKSTAFNSTYRQPINFEHTEFLS